MDTLPYRQDIRYANQPDCTNGIESSVLQQWRDRLPAAVATLHQQAKDLPFLQLPYVEDDLAEIESVAAHLRRSKRLFVFGTGGSSLGGKTLVALKQGGFDLPDHPVHFVENVDPHTLRSLLDHGMIEEAGFLAISKSGNTVETISQTALVLEALEQRVGKQAAANQIVCITEPGDRPLRALAQQHGLRVLDHHPNIGGRFSVFSNVGLIPAAAAGVDIRALRAGARAALDHALAVTESAPAMGALMQTSAMRSHPIHVLMPYCDRLESLTAWFKQLWAESLAKNGHGSTAVRALGTVDQHSQLQLYLDGPRDKIFTLILPDFSDEDPVVPVTHVPSLAYLEGHQFGTVMRAMQHGTLEALKDHHCPVRVIRLAKVDEKSMGALLMHFELETVLTASLIEVNPFDQPAVEHSKRLAREYLYEHRKGA